MSSATQNAQKKSNTYRSPDPFAQASATAVISDLHLCEEEPENHKHPLWKKYKTRQFFFDRDFSDWLNLLEEKAQGESIELVFNGDIFDFDSVTHLPKKPPYRVSWLERRRGLRPEEQKSMFKIKRILQDHEEWVQALRRFIEMPDHHNRAVFIIGNHDLELHFPGVQKAIRKALGPVAGSEEHLRFVEWFYISNKDTVIEHGNQYDPYCVAPDPINPFVLKYNRLEVRIPFGNLATRFMVNGMGFFNPHVDTNYLMSAKEYVKFFFRYIVKAQPLLLLTWLWGASATLFQSFLDRLRPPLRNPLTIEDRIEDIAERSNATPRMVREMKELSAPPAANNPILIARELWLDRAFLILVAFVAIFQLFLFLQTVYSISFFWMFIPLAIYLPFFMFYSKSITSDVVRYKEPNEKILTTTGMITKVNRIIYGHSHQARHEMIGPIEHLNSGTWSPAFKDVECRHPIDSKTYIWIEPSGPGERSAELLQFKDGKDIKVVPSRPMAASSE